MGTSRSPAPVAARQQATSGKASNGSSAAVAAQRQAARNDKRPAQQPVIAAPAPEPAPAPVVPETPISNNETQVAEIAPWQTFSKTIASSRKVGPQRAMQQARSRKTR